MQGCSPGSNPIRASNIAPATVPPGAGTGESGLGQGPAAVNLGLAANFAVLAKTAISTVPGSPITGNIGISPAAASFITGFSLTAPPTTYSSSSQITGQVFAADYDPPTPTNMTTAVSNMETAYTDAAGRVPDYNELGAGNISGMTLPPATYKWGTGLLMTTDVAFSGGPHDVWILQVAGNITMATNVRIILSGGALAKNIFWQTAGNVTVGTYSHFEGNILSQTSITLNTGTSMNGRLLAQSAVALDQNVIVKP